MLVLAMKSTVSKTLQTLSTNRNFTTMHNPITLPGMRNVQSYGSAHSMNTNLGYMRPVMVGIYRLYPIFQNGEATVNIFVGPRGAETT